VHFKLGGAQVSRVLVAPSCASAYTVHKWNCFTAYPSWVPETAITRLSIKHLFYDTIEQIRRHIKGHGNTKENLHHG